MDGQGYQAGKGGDVNIRGGDGGPGSPGGDVKIIAVRDITIRGGDGGSIATGGLDSTISGQTPADVTDKADGGKRVPINARMMDLIIKKPECHTWSAQQFADALGCSKSTVSETQAWASLGVYREMARQERAAVKQTKWQDKGQETGR